MDRNYIIESNKAARLLRLNGYTLQGRTKGMEEIAIEKNSKLLFYKDYITAAKHLL